MVESTEQFKVWVSAYDIKLKHSVSEVKMLEVNQETKMMLRNDPRFLELRRKKSDLKNTHLAVKNQVKAEEDWEAEVDEQIAKIQQDDEPDLDLGPLTEALLPLFSAVAEFISAFGGIHKDYAIKKVLCLFNQSLFNMIKTFLESNAPEVTEMLENIQLYTSKILVLIDLNTILKSRK